MSRTQLTYFKASGKYYTEGKTKHVSDTFWEAVGEIKAMAAEGRLPGLESGRWEEGPILVRFGRWDVPHLLVPEPKSPVKACYKIVAPSQAVLTTLLDSLASREVDTVNCQRLVIGLTRLNPDVEELVEKLGAKLVIDAVYDLERNE